MAPTACVRFAWIQVCNHACCTLYTPSDFDQPLLAKDSNAINNKSSTYVVIYVGDEHNTAGSAGSASLHRGVCLVNERIHHPLTRAADLHLMYRNIKTLNPQ